MDNYSAPKKMKRIGDLFEKYKTRLKAPQSTVEKECIKVIAEVTGHQLASGSVSYTVSTRTISLRVPSLLKSEIRFHHQTILKKLEENLGKETAPVVIV